MSFLERMGLALKALTITKLPNKPSAWGYQPRSKFDYELYGGDGRQSSIIMACVRWVQRTFPEAPSTLETLNRAGEWEQVGLHPLLSLLDTPNEFYDGYLLQAATIADMMLSGNAYWLKLHSMAGRTVQLHWVPSTMLEPKWPTGGTEFISHYEYRPGGGTLLKLEINDVVHFRDGLDPKNTRKGLSPLGSLFREIFTDHEAANMTAALLKNLGVPGLLISPEGDSNVSADELKAVKGFLTERFTGDYRGEPLVLGGPTKVQAFGFNPQQMELRNLRLIPEERISAVLGVPAIVAGLGAGLARSTFANYAEAREAAYESTIIPLQRLFTSVIKRQLLRDFENDLERWQVGYDLSQVRILQEDETAKVDRLGRMVTGGWLKVAEAQRLAGMPVDETQDHYLRLLAVMEVGSKSVREAPAEEAALALLPEQKGGDDPRMLARLDLFLKRHTVHEGRFVGWLKREFGRQEKEALVQLEGRKQERGDIFPLDVETRRMSEGAAPYLRAMLFASAEDAAAELGAVFNITNPAVTKWLGERTRLFGRNVNETTAKAIAVELREAHALGETIPEISRRVRVVFSEANKTRATMIARTELTAASNKGAYEAWKESGVVRGREWLSAADERVRPAHFAAHGQIVGMDQPFKVGGEDIMHPGEGSPDNSINCRCAEGPVPIGETRAALETRCPICGRFLGLDLKGQVFCPKCNKNILIGHRWLI